MKRLSLIVLLFTSASIFSAANITPQEQAELAKINLRIASIRERFTAMGVSCERCSACPGQIEEYLKGLGTPVALRLLKELKQQKLIR